MATLQELQAQRAQILKEIERRGGKDQAKGFVVQLNEVEAQIRAARGTNNPAQAPAAAPTPARTNVAAELPKKIDNVGDAIKADTAVERNQAETQIGYSNPDVTGPLGSSQTTVDPATGRVQVNQELSDGQQKVLAADEALSEMSRKAATGAIGAISQPFNPNLAPRQGFDPSGTVSQPFSYSESTRLANPSVTAQPFQANLTPRTLSGDLVSDRQRIEDQVFASLTRNADRDYQRAREDKEQWAENRGIPFGSEAWKNAMSEVDEAYTLLKSDARAKAVQMGGEEYSRSFDIGETTRANDFSQQLGTRQQNSSEYGQQSAIDESRIAGEFDRSAAARATNFGEATQRFSMGETARANDFSQGLAAHGANLETFGALSGAGSGPIIPNFQPYSAPNYQVGAPSDMALALKQIGLDERQINAAIEEMKRQGARSGGGGGGSSSGTAATTPSPFNNTPPPGL